MTPQPSHRGSWKWAITVLVVLHTLVGFAGFFAPYNPETQHRDVPLAPPSPIHFVDEEKKWHLRPFVYAQVANESGKAGYREDTGHKFPIEFLVRGTEYQVVGLWSCNLHLFSVVQPGQIFLFGTDSYGRDVFSRFLYGGRISLAAGLLAATISLLLALVLGGIAGYYGGWVDGLIMRLAELFLSLPWLYMLFAVRAFLPLNLDASRAFFLIISLVGLISWARPARIIRGIVLTAKERDFVLAARSFGAGDFYLLWRHILPQALSVTITQAALLVPAYILAEVTLSFLGLGVNEPVASWGNMLGALQQYSVLVTAWWMFTPGIALVFVIWSYHSLAAALESHWRTVQV